MATNDLEYVKNETENLVETGNEKAEEVKNKLKNNVNEDV